MTMGLGSLHRDRSPLRGRVTLPPAPAAPRVGRRRTVWWIGGVLAIAAVVVVLDLPTHANSSYRKSALHTYLSGVAHDVAQCRVGLHDAVVAYVGSVTGSPSVAGGVPATFTRQAIAVCGFADAGVVDLGTTEPPQPVASRVVDRIAHQVDAWAYLDAFNLLQDLRRVIAAPAQRAPREAFAHELALLHRRRARIESLVTSAEHAVGARPRAMSLTSVTALLPHGTLPEAGGPNTGGGG